MSSIQVVNGYVCQSCSDVALAKKGVNPSHPQDDPSSPNYNAASAKADKAKEAGVVTASVVFGGSLSGLNQTPAAGGTSGVSALSGTSVNGTASQGSASQGSASQGSSSGGSTNAVTQSANPPISTLSYSDSIAGNGDRYSPGYLLNTSA
jgi:hypothetical protein